MKKIIIITSFLLLAIFLYGFNKNKEKIGPWGPAYVVTWQNKYQKWHAAGPNQNIQYAEETEDDAIGRVVNKKREGYKLTFLKECGKFRVYTVGYNNASYDFDAMSYVKKREGYSCETP